MLVLLALFLFSSMGCAVERPAESQLKNRDSSIKKNSAFVKKLRNNLFEANRAALLLEIKKLNLTKYIPEAVSSLAALSKLKKADIPTAVEVAVALHQTYEEFTVPLREALKAVLKPSMDADKEVGLTPCCLCFCDFDLHRSSHLFVLL